MRDISRRTEWLAGLARSRRDREIIVPQALATGSQSIPAAQVPVGRSQDAERPFLDLPVIPALPGISDVVVRRDDDGTLRGEVVREEVPIDWEQFEREYRDLNPDDTGEASIEPVGPPIFIPPTPKQAPEPPYPQQPTESDMAQDWGDFAQGAIQGIIRNVIGNEFTGPMPPAVSVPSPVGSPAKVTVDTRTGRVTRCTRRRRRRLLTPTDLSDLAALQALVGKGSSALNMAVAKAVRR